MPRGSRSRRTLSAVVSRRHCVCCRNRHRVEPSSTSDTTDRATTGSTGVMQRHRSDAASCDRRSSPCVHSSCADRSDGSRVAVLALSATQRTGRTDLFSSSFTYHALLRGCCAATGATRESPHLYNESLPYFISLFKDKMYIKRSSITSLKCYSFPATLRYATTFELRSRLSTPYPRHCESNNVNTNGSDCDGC